MGRKEITSAGVDSFERFMRFKCLHLFALSVFTFAPGTSTIASDIDFNPDWIAVLLAPAYSPTMPSFMQDKTKKNELWLVDADGSAQYYTYRESYLDRIAIGSSAESAEVVQMFNQQLNSITMQSLPRAELATGTGLTVEHVPDYIRIVTGDKNDIRQVYAGQPREMPLWAIELVKDIKRVCTSSRSPQTSARGDRWIAAFWNAPDMKMPGARALEDAELSNQLLSDALANPFRLYAVEREDDLPDWLREGVRPQACIVGSHVFRVQRFTFEGSGTSKP